jgi:predicted hydrocarbon binding protein
MKDPEVLSKVRVFLREEGVIIPKGPIKEFYSQLMKLSGFGIGGLLTFSGKKAGKMAGTYIRSIVGEENPSMSMVVPYVSAFLGETGICKVEEYELLDSQVLFKVRDSIFAQDIENKKPVCMPLSGALAGLFEEITGKEWECKELECKAQGKELCIFEVKLKR